ncbi:hypothetical protein AAG570_004881 [Ranatra chinensis]|uniref:Uncharacterized protein n=1 Tax=Ranatra chinensis TaxID=642074 RepID=A0ABD0XYT9_9HEMI
MVFKFPEIYAILHPELYVDVRECEKEKLVANFARRNFGELSRAPNRDSVARYRHTVPTWNLYDLRQKEKERFARIVASAVPALLHNIPPPTAAPPRSRRSLPSDRLLDRRVEDIRDKEKERLARIFASTLPPKRGPSRQRRNTTSEVPPGCGVGRQANGKPPEAEQFSLPGLDQMVRSGEYSSLKNGDSANSPGGGDTRHLLGFGDHDERRKLSLDKRKKEYREYLTQAKQEAARSKMDSADSTTARGNGGVSRVHRDVEVDSSPPRTCCSASTQTDPEDFHEDLPSPGGSQSDNQVAKSSSSEASPVSPTTVQHSVFASPREKLISDLHGVANFFSAEDERSVPMAEELRLKQTAYAEALKAQILEKRRLEAERKKRDQEEEEAIEKKAREQQERLAMEYQREQAQRVDWIQQKAAQEEMLRQRLVEMQLETQQLKREERNKKRSLNSNIGTVNELDTTERTARQHNSKLIHNSVSAAPGPGGDSHHYLGSHPGTSVGGRITACIFEKNRGGSLSPGLERLTRTPLVEADTQNILSDKYLPRSENKLSMASPRPTSPILPALRTESLLKKNTQLLVNKWTVPPGVGVAPSPVADDGVMRPGDTVLTQLGAFRRQLQLEHARMSRRLQRAPEGGATALSS